MRGERAAGYTLLSIGLGLIMVSLYLLLTVFLGHTAPPKIIGETDIVAEIPVSTPYGEATVKMDLGFLAKVFNVGFWYLLCIALTLIGGRVAGLGVNLLKEVRVEIKEE